MANGSWHVQLDEETRPRAVEAAHRRYYGHRQRGTGHRYGLDGADYTVEDEVNALGAEFAAAELLGQEWVDTDDPALDRREGDLGNGRQVRQTPYWHGCLLLHEDDADEHVFMLAFGTFPNYTFPGWLYGHEGKNPERWGALRGQQGRECFINRQADLNPWTT